MTQHFLVCLFLVLVFYNKLSVPRISEGGREKQGVKENQTIALSSRLPKKGSDSSKETGRL